MLRTIRDQSERSPADNPLNSRRQQKTQLESFTLEPRGDAVAEQQQRPFGPTRQTA